MQQIKNLVKNNNMKRQRITIGSILEIRVHEKYYFYAQILKGGKAFFDFMSEQPISDVTILSDKPILFIIAVYNDVITSGHWPKVGKLDIRDDLKVLPLKFIQDALDPTSFSIYDPNSGEIIPSTKEACKGLERSSVWDAHHVEQRLLDHLEGRINKYVQEAIDALE